MLTQDLPCNHMMSAQIRQYSYTSPMLSACSTIQAVHPFEWVQVKTRRYSWGEKQDRAGWMAAIECLLQGTRYTDLKSM